MIDNVWKWATTVLGAILVTGLIAWVTFGNVKTDVVNNAARLDRVENALDSLTGALHGVQVESAVLSRELSLTRESLKDLATR